MLVRATLLVILASALAAATACERNDNSLKNQFVRSGDAYAAKKRYAEAIIEYRRAVQIDPKFGTARYKLAEAYAATDDTLNALGEYVRAADVMPENEELQLKAGNLLLLFGRFQDAKTRARTVLKRDPKHPIALILLGNALAGLRALDDAVVVAERVTEQMPNRPGLYTNLGALRLARGDTEMAEAAFKRAVAVGGKAIPPYLALSNFYRASGRVADAERLLREVLTIDPKHLQANRLLGGLLVEASRPLEAEPFFKAATLTNDAPSQIALADYYASTKRPQEAIAVLNKVAADKANFNMAKTRIAIIQLGSGQREAAYRTVEEVLAKSPKDANIQAFKAQILLADRRVEEALALIKEASLLDQRAPQVHLIRGRILAARNQIEEARKAYAEAMDLDRFNVEAALELSQLHMRRQEVDSSITFAERAVKANPDSLTARLALVKALTVRSEDYPRAENEVKTLLTRYPAQAAVHAAWGKICMLNRDPAGARKAFERALQFHPQNPEAWTGIMALDVAGKNLAGFRKRLETQLGSQTSTELLLIEAKVAVLARDLKKAEQTLLQAISHDPSHLESFTALGQLYVFEKRLPDATKEFLKVAQLEPNSVPASTMLGLLYHAQNNIPEAEKWYERAVQADPVTAAAAGNNLAWLYVEQGGNLDVAQRLAQYAKARSPDQPQFNDTLGWIYYKRGLTTQALNVLPIAVNAVPNNAIYHYHLGMAYAQGGEDSKARKELERALKLAPTFRGSDEARKTLEGLVY